MNTTRFPETLPEVVLSIDAVSVRVYADLTADHNPLHLDPEFAAQTPFGKPISHGTLALNLLVDAGLSAAPQLRVKTVDIRFVAPCPVGETVTTGFNLVDGQTGLYEAWLQRSDGKRIIEGTVEFAEPS